MNQTVDIASHFKSNETLDVQISESINRGDFHLSIIALVALIAWSIYTMFYSTRVMGLIVSVIARRFIKKGYFKLGSISFSAIGGNMMLRNFAYMTKDVTIRFNYAVIVFNYWTPFKMDVSQHQRCLSISIYGLDIHLYNRTSVYDELCHIFDESKRKSMSASESSEPTDLARKIRRYAVKRNVGISADDQDGESRGRQKASQGGLDLFWNHARRLLPVIKINMERAKLCVGNHLLPRAFLLTCNRMEANYSLKEASSWSDKYQHHVDSKFQTLMASFIPITRYAGLHAVEEAPRCWDNGFRLLHFGSGSCVYAYDEPGLVSLEPEQMHISNGNGTILRTWPQWSLSLLVDKTCQLNYGPWADRQREILWKYFFPASYEPAKVSEPPTVGQPRAVQKFVLEVSTVTNIDVNLLFTNKNEVKCVQLTGRPGSSFKMSLPLVTKPNGFVTGLRASLVNGGLVVDHLWSQVLQTKQLDFDVRLHYPREWNMPQLWKVEVDAKGAEFTMLFDYKHFFKGLIDDWTKGAFPDLIHFVPCTYSFRFNCLGLQFMLPANEFNWVSTSVENAIVAFYVKKLLVTFELPFVDFLPETVQVTYTIEGVDLGLRLSLPETSTMSHVIRELHSRLKLVDRSGRPLSSNPFSLYDKVLLGLLPDGKVYHRYWVDCARAPSISLRIGYTYHPSPWVSEFWSFLPEHLRPKIAFPIQTKNWPLSTGPQGYNVDFGSNRSRRTTTSGRGHHRSRTKSPLDNSSHMKLEELALSGLRPEGDQSQGPTEDFLLRNFSANCLPPDIVDCHLHIPSAQLCFYGTLLKHFINLKENYFGCNQIPVDFASPPISSAQYESSVNCDTPSAAVFADPGFTNDAATGRSRRRSSINRIVDPRVYRPMVVRLSLEFHNIQAHLPTHGFVCSAPCPTAFLDCIGFEMDKRLQETKIQLVFSPILLCVYDMCKDYRPKSWKNLSKGRLQLMGLCLRGQGMFSHEGSIPLAAESLEYSWLLELNIGRLSGQLSAAQLASIVHGLNGLLFGVTDPENQLVDSRAYELCQHGHAQDLCPYRHPVLPEKLCPGELSLKYRMTRVSLDGVNVALVEFGSCFGIQLDPVRLSMCNMHGTSCCNGIVMVVMNVRLVQYIRPTTQPRTGQVAVETASSQHQWIEAGSLVFGPVHMNITQTPNKPEQMLLQMAFLKRHDESTKRLWFLWSLKHQDDSTISHLPHFGCGCFGNCSFFGPNKSGRELCEELKTGVFHQRTVFPPRCRYTVDSDQPSATFRPPFPSTSNTDVSSAAQDDRPKAEDNLPSAAVDAVEFGESILLRYHLIHELHNPNVCIEETNGIQLMRFEVVAACAAASTAAAAAASNQTTTFYNDGCCCSASEFSDTDEEVSNDGGSRDRQTWAINPSGSIDHFSMTEVNLYAVDGQERPNPGVSRRRRGDGSYRADTSSQQSSMYEPLMSSESPEHRMPRQTVSGDSSLAVDQADRTNALTTGRPSYHPLNLSLTSLLGPTTPEYSPRSSVVVEPVNLEVGTSGRPLLTPPTPPPRQLVFKDSQLTVAADTDVCGLSRAPGGTQQDFPSLPREAAPSASGKDLLERTIDLKNHLNRPITESSLLRLAYSNHLNTYMCTEGEFSSLKLRRRWHLCRRLFDAASSRVDVPCATLSFDAVRNCRVGGALPPRFQLLRPGFSMRSIVLRSGKEDPANQPRKDSANMFSCSHPEMTYSQADARIWLDGPIDLLVSPLFAEAIERYVHVLSPILANTPPSAVIDGMHYSCVKLRRDKLHPTSDKPPTTAHAQSVEPARPPNSHTSLRRHSHMEAGRPTSLVSDSAGGGSTAKYHHLPADGEPRSSFGTASGHKLSAPGVLFPITTSSRPADDYRLSSSNSVANDGAQACSATDGHDNSTMPARVLRPNISLGEGSRFDFQPILLSGRSVFAPGKFAELNVERINICFLQLYAVEDLVHLDSLRPGLHDLTCSSLFTLCVDSFAFKLVLFPKSDDASSSPSEPIQATTDSGHSATSVDQSRQPLLQLSAESTPKLLHKISPAKHALGIAHHPRDATQTAELVQGSPSRLFQHGRQPSAPPVLTDRASVTVSDTTTIVSPLLPPIVTGRQPVICRESAFPRAQSSTQTRFSLPPLTLNEDDTAGSAFDIDSKELVASPLANSAGLQADQGPGCPSLRRQLSASFPQSRPLGSDLVCQLRVARINGQLRRLTHCSEFGPGILLTAIPFHSSTAFFAFEPDTECSRATSLSAKSCGQRLGTWSEHSAGWIMCECGLEQLTLSCNRRDGFAQLDGRPDTLQVSVDNISGNQSILVLGANGGRGHQSARNSEAQETAGVCSRWGDAASSQAHRKWRQSSDSTPKTPSDSPILERQCNGVWSRLHIVTLWLNFPTPKHLPNKRRIELIRSDWNLLSTAAPTIKAWMDPCDRLVRACQGLVTCMERRLLSVTACLMTEAVNPNAQQVVGTGPSLLHCLTDEGLKAYSQHRTPVARALQLDPSCQLFVALRRYLFNLIRNQSLPTADRLLSAWLADDAVPPNELLQSGILLLTREWRILVDLLNVSKLAEAATPSAGASRDRSPATAALAFLLPGRLGGRPLTEESQAAPEPVPSAGVFSPMTAGRPIQAGGGKSKLSVHYTAGPISSVSSRLLRIATSAMAPMQPPVPPSATLEGPAAGTGAANDYDSNSRIPSMDVFEPTGDSVWDSPDKLDRDDSGNPVNNIVLRRFLNDTKSNVQAAKGTIDWHHYGTHKTSRQPVDPATGAAESKLTMAYRLPRRSSLSSLTTLPVQSSGGEYASPLLRTVSPVAMTGHHPVDPDAGTGTGASAGPSRPTQQQPAPLGSRPADFTVTTADLEQAAHLSAQFQHVAYIQRFFSPLLESVGLSPRGIQKTTLMKKFNGFFSAEGELRNFRIDIVASARNPLSPRKGDAASVGKIPSTSGAQPSRRHAFLCHNFSSKLTMRDVLDTASQPDSSTAVQSLPGQGGLSMTTKVDVLFNVGGLSQHVNMPLLRLVHQFVIMSCCARDMHMNMASLRPHDDGSVNPSIYGTVHRNSLHKHMSSKASSDCTDGTLHSRSSGYTRLPEGSERIGHASGQHPVATVSTAANSSSSPGQLHSVFTCETALIATGTQGLPATGSTTSAMDNLASARLFSPVACWQRLINYVDLCTTVPKTKTIFQEVAPPSGHATVMPMITEEDQVLAADERGPSVVTTSADNGLKLLGRRMMSLVNNTYPAVGDDIEVGSVTTGLLAIPLPDWGEAGRRSEIAAAAAAQEIAYPWMRSERVPLTIFLTANISKMSITAVLSELNMSAHVCNAQGSFTYTTRLKGRGNFAEKSIAQSVCSHYEKCQLSLTEKSRLECQRIISMQLNGSHAMVSSSHCRQTSRIGCLVSLGAIAVTVPHHPVRLHDVVQRQAKKISHNFSTLRFNRSASDVPGSLASSRGVATTPTTGGSTTTGTTISDVAAPFHHSRQAPTSPVELPDAAAPAHHHHQQQPLPKLGTSRGGSGEPPPSVLSLLAVAQGLTLNVALHSTLTAVYHISPVYCIGNLGARGHVNIRTTEHSLKLKSEHSSENIARKIKIPLPNIFVSISRRSSAGGSYTVGVRKEQSLSYGLTARKGDYFDVLVTIDVLEQTLTTDLLNYIVVVVQLFMREIKEVIHKMAGDEQDSDTASHNHSHRGRHAVIRSSSHEPDSEPAGLFSGAARMKTKFSIRFRMKEIQLLATTRSGALKFEARKIEVELTNRVIQPVLVHAVSSISGGGGGREAVKPAQAAGCSGSIRPSNLRLAGSSVAGGVHQACGESIFICGYIAKICAELGYLQQDVMYTEPEFKAVAMFKTSFALRSLLADEMKSMAGASQSDLRNSASCEQNAFLISLNQPTFWLKPFTFDRGILMWMVYKSEFKKWKEHMQHLTTSTPSIDGQPEGREASSSRHTAGGLLNEPGQRRPRSGVINKSVPLAEDCVNDAEYAGKNTLFLQLNVKGLGICLPINLLQLNSQNMEADSRTALVLTLEHSRVSACYRDSLVGESEFNNFCLRFDDEFNVGSDDWKPDWQRATVNVRGVKHTVILNACVVPSGTFSVGWRAPEKRAQWRILIEWQMRGLDFHLDSNIGRRLKALTSVLTSMTGLSGAAPLLPTSAEEEVEEGTNQNVPAQEADDHQQQTGSTQGNVSEQQHQGGELAVVLQRQSSFRSQVNVKKRHHDSFIRLLSQARSVELDKHKQDLYEAQYCQWLKRQKWSSLRRRRGNTAVLSRRSNRVRSGQAPGRVERPTKGGHNFVSFHSSSNQTSVDNVASYSFQLGHLASETMLPGPAGFVCSDSLESLVSDSRTPTKNAEGQSPTQTISRTASVYYDAENIGPDQAGVWAAIVEPLPDYSRRQDSGTASNIDKWFDTPEDHLDQMDDALSLRDLEGNEDSEQACSSCDDVYDTIQGLPSIPTSGKLKQPPPPPRRLGLAAQTTAAAAATTTTATAGVGDETEAWGQQEALPTLHLDFDIKIHVDSGRCVLHPRLPMELATSDEQQQQQKQAGMRSVITGSNLFSVGEVNPSHRQFGYPIGSIQNTLSTGVLLPPDVGSKMGMFSTNDLFIYYLERYKQHLLQGTQHLATNISIFYLPAVDIGLHYDSTTELDFSDSTILNGLALHVTGQSPTVESVHKATGTSPRSCDRHSQPATRIQVGDDPTAASSCQLPRTAVLPTASNPSNMMKQADLYVSCFIKKLPKDLVVQPTLLDFLEQALEDIPWFRDETPETEFSDKETVSDAGNKSESNSTADSLQGFLAQSFPVHTVVHLQVQPSTIKFLCLPASRMQCLMALPFLDVVFSTKRNRSGSNSESCGAAANWTDPVYQPSDDSNELGQQADPRIDNDVISDGGIYVTAILKEFRISINHPGGDLKFNRHEIGWSTALPDDSLTLLVRDIHFNLSRMVRTSLVRLTAPLRSTNGVPVDVDSPVAASASLLQSLGDQSARSVGNHRSTSMPAVAEAFGLRRDLQFSGVFDVGCALFYCDTRRTLEILDIPNAWYRSTLARQLFLGNQNAATGDHGNTTVSMSDQSQSATRPTAGSETKQEVPPITPRFTIGPEFPDESTPPTRVRQATATSPNRCRPSARARDYRFRASTTGGGGRVLPGSSDQRQTSKSMTFVVADRAGSGSRVGSLPLTVWHSTPIFCAHIKHVDLITYMGSAMGRTRLTVDKLFCDGHLSIASSGRKKTILTAGWAVCQLTSEGGGVGGEWSCLDTGIQLCLDKDPAKDPQHNLKLHVGGFQLRIEYMNTNILLLRVNDFNLGLHDEWKLRSAGRQPLELFHSRQRQQQGSVLPGEGCQSYYDASNIDTDVSRPPVYIRVVGEVSWDQAQTAIVRTTTPDLLRSMQRIREYFEDQVRTGRRSLIGEGGSFSMFARSHRSPLFTELGSYLPTTSGFDTAQVQEDEKAFINKLLHRHWQSVLYDSFKVYLTELLGFTPDDSDLQSAAASSSSVYPVLGGSLQLSGRSLGVACFAGSLSAAPDWAVFNIQYPNVCFDTEAQHEAPGSSQAATDPSEADGWVNVHQMLSFDLGTQPEFQPQMAYVLRVQRGRQSTLPRNLPKLTIAEWMEFTFLGADDTVVQCVRAINPSRVNEVVQLSKFPIIFPASLPATIPAECFESISSNNNANRPGEKFRSPRDSAGQTSPIANNAPAPSSRGKPTEQAAVNRPNPLRPPTEVEKLFILPSISMQITSYQRQTMTSPLHCNLSGAAKESEPECPHDEPPQTLATPNGRSASVIPPSPPPERDSSRWGSSWLPRTSKNPTSVPVTLPPKTTTAPAAKNVDTSAGSALDDRLSPVVKISFQADFHSFVQLGLIDVPWLPNLINSYLNKRLEAADPVGTARTGASVPLVTATSGSGGTSSGLHPLAQSLGFGEVTSRLCQLAATRSPLVHDARTYEIVHWIFSPEFRWLMAQSIAVPALDRLLESIGFRRARITIPKWLQRGVMDHLDKAMTVVLRANLRLLTAERDEVAETLSPGKPVQQQGEDEANRVNL